MSATCSNPNCSCDPCRCDGECRCSGGTRLGELEQQVMDVVWAAGEREVTPREVTDALGVYAYTTVATVLNRLSRKGVLHRRGEERVTHFAAVATEAERAASSMEGLVRKTEDSAAVLRSFAKRLDPSELETLRRALDDRAGDDSPAT